MLSDQKILKGTCSGCIDYNQEILPKPYLSEDPEEVLVSKGYPAIILDEYVIDANFTLEHCGCQRYLKGIVHCKYVQGNYSGSTVKKM